MANLVPKLIKRAPSLRIVAAAPLSNRVADPDFATYNSLTPIPFLNPTPNSNPPTRAAADVFHFYACPHSFPFGFSLNPISVPGFCPGDGEGVATDGAADDESRTVWADSVKKKRKKKMNKHKYKKLRKKLRRKARSS